MLNPPVGMQHAVEGICCTRRAGQAQMAMWSLTTSLSSIMTKIRSSRGWQWKSLPMSLLFPFWCTKIPLISLKKKWFKDAEIFGQEQSRCPRNIPGMLCRCTAWSEAVMLLNTKCWTPQDGRVYLLLGPACRLSTDIWLATGETSC